MNRFTSLCSEMVRITKYNFNPTHIKVIWQMYGIDGFTGCKERALFDTDRHFVCMVPRNSLDQVLDFIADGIRAYRRAFAEAMCTHPHKKCWVEIEGDREYGFCKQYLCGNCGGYIGDKMVMDRFDGGTLVSKDHLKPDFIPRGYRDYEVELDRQHADEAVDDSLHPPYLLGRSYENGTPSDKMPKLA